MEQEDREQEEREQEDREQEEREQIQSKVHTASSFRNFSIQSETSPDRHGRLWRCSLWLSL